MRILKIRCALEGKPYENWNQLYLLCCFVIIFLVAEPSKWSGLTREDSHRILASSSTLLRFAGERRVDAQAGFPLFPNEHLNMSVMHRWLVWCCRCSWAAVIPYHQVSIRLNSFIKRNKRPSTIYKLLSIFCLQ